jgi:hypothetical protein
MRPKLKDGCSAKQCSKFHVQCQVLIAITHDRDILCLRYRPVRECSGGQILGLFHTQQENQQEFEMCFAEPAVENEFERPQVVAI